MDDRKKNKEAEKVTITPSDESTSEKGHLFGLDETIESIKDAISDFESGKILNIAIIAPSYAGKSVLVDEIVNIYSHEVTKVSFSSIITDKEEIPLSEDQSKIMIFDNCHYLYMRKIGGFAVLHAFLNMVLEQDARLCISTWNIHSWNYLGRVLDIGKYFPVQIKIPPLNSSQMKEFLLSEYEDGEILFVNDVEAEDKQIFHVVKKPLAEKATHGRIKLYTLKVNYVALRSLLMNKGTPDETAESIIIKEITRISRGNPGVAKKLWKKWLEYPIIKTSNIDKFSPSINIDVDSRFILYLILSMGYIKKCELNNIMNWKCSVDDVRINMILFELLNQELIQINDEYYSIRADKLHLVTKYLEDCRLVW